MKKFRGTKYAHIGTSYTPILNAKFAEIETALLGQQARFNEIELRILHLLGLDHPEQDA